MLTIPEIIGLDSRSGVIRIPQELDVPLTDRVRRIIDTEQFRRLASIPQVGLVSLVYPAAKHTRFEHSLGVYRLALLFLKMLAHIPAFAQIVSKRDAELLIVSSLLHDIGHYPFCHLIEDIRLDGIPHHESLAAEYLKQEPLQSLLRSDWQTEPDEVADLLTGNFPPENTAQSKAKKKTMQVLSSILSGPIDIDKMDYLFRDSIHSGVAYGKNLDQERLIGSICINQNGTGLAVTEKGKTAAELMVFARYVMFSEVYWHHTVRAATAMMQMLFTELYDAGKIELRQFFSMTENEAVNLFLESSCGLPCGCLAEGLFGRQRSVYKRLVQFSILEQPELYRKLAGRPYRELRKLADKLSAVLSEKCFAGSEKKQNDNYRIRPALLIDAPPVEKEVEIKIDIFYPKENIYRPLENVSPIVRSMAKEQFDDYTKRVRIFVHPALAEDFRNKQDVLFELLKNCVFR
ncbi:oxidoreductase [Planctomycetales bacterium]|nr:oxidoreductase [Planctomycetales bacterium]